MIYSSNLLLLLATSAGSSAFTLGSRGGSSSSIIPPVYTFMNIKSIPPAKQSYGSKRGSETRAYGTNSIYDIYRSNLAISYIYGSGSAGWLSSIGVQHRLAIYLASS